MSDDYEQKRDEALGLIQAKKFMYENGQEQLGLTGFPDAQQAIDQLVQDEVRRVLRRISDATVSHSDVGKLSDTVIVNRLTSKLLAEFTQLTNKSNREK